MNVNPSAPAPAATRFRAVYRITTGPVGGLAGARDAAAQITEAWQGSSAAFVVRESSEPIQGGTPGAAALGIVAAVAGFSDYFTAIDLKTAYALPSMTWRQLLGPYQELGIGWRYIGATLDHAELVTGAPAAAPASQTGAASSSAAASRAAAPLPLILDGLGAVLPWLLVGFAIVAGVLLYRRARG